MTTPRLVSMLLLTTALAMPSLAHAQDEDKAQDQTPQNGSDQTAPSGAGQDQPPPEVSIPGGEIVVTGRREANVTRAAPQVVSVLSSEDIKRTGEGNIAGALSRVTGLSVVGKGFVYVRGLGDRYSLALLNGSPLPSPEPLKRVVPLDMFPSSVIASSLVQKSFSANFPGEFGGGLINLTTTAAPKEGFLSIAYGMSADTETTGQLGYTYYGSSTDWTGYDNGQRNVPPGLAAFFASGARISSGDVDTFPISSQLVNGRNAVLQWWGNLPPNFTGTITAGKSFDIGSDVTLGVIATGGYRNSWNTRGATNQFALASDLATNESDFYRVTTDDRVIANGLLGFGLQWGNNTIRWTNLYIHDTIKDARLGIGTRHGTDQTYMQQNTAWYERQLIDTQVVGEFQLADGLSLDLRGSYANSKRNAPAELYFEYVRTNVDTDPLGDMFVNQLNNGQSGDARISYSKLNEDLWSAGADLTYRLSPAIAATIGYAYLDTRRTSSRRDFQFTAPSDMPKDVGLLRPDFLLQWTTIKAFNIELIETNEGNPAFLATFRNHGAYAKVDLELGDTIDIDAGVRFETGNMAVTPIEVFTVPGSSTATTAIRKDYWLPTATLTWNLRPDMQLRLNGSQTIARPQFRELLYQPYFDPDTNRAYAGNPLLTDSKLINAEARWEWYFARGQRLSVAGFYKKIDKPIETFITGIDFITTFANAPSANLYGAEVEVQKNFDLYSWGGFFESRRLVLIGNYTYSKSRLKVGATDTVSFYGAAATAATAYFRDGEPLTGQSEHIGNIEIGLEDQDHLSQQTFLVSYASKRVTSRGINNTGQPDVFEVPGWNVDFVARQGIKLFGLNTEWKFEARNLLGTRHQEFQTNGIVRVDYNTYDVGRTFALTLTLNL